MLGSRSLWRTWTLCFVLADTACASGVRVGTTGPGGNENAEVVPRPTESAAVTRASSDPQARRSVDGGGAAAAGSGAAVKPLFRATLEWLVVPVDHSDVPYLAIGPNGTLAFATHHSGVAFKSDMFVSLLAPDGSTRWNQPAIGRFVRGVAITRERVYLATEFSGRVVMGDLTVRGEDIHGFVGALSLDSGRPVWGQGFGTPGVDRVNDVAAMPDGVAVAHGFFGKGRVGSTELIPAGGEDAAVTKWSADGRPIWTATFAYERTDNVQGIRPATDGASFVFGTRYSTKSTWAHEKDASAYRGWVARLRATGTVEWLTELGGDGGQVVVRDLVVHNAGAVLSGAASGVTELGGHPLDGKHFLAGISNAGRLDWVRSFERVAALAPVDASRLILCTEGGLLAVNGALPKALDTPTRLLAWDQKTIYGPIQCKSSPATSGDATRTLYVAAQAATGATLAGKPLPEPRVRFGPRLPEYSKTFVAAVRVE